MNYTRQTIKKRKNDYVTLLTQNINKFYEFTYTHAFPPGPVLVTFLRGSEPAQFLDEKSC